MCGLEDNVRNRKLKGMRWTHKDIRYRKKTTKEATKKMLWNTDGELALERKKETFF